MSQIPIFHCPECHKTGYSVICLDEEYDVENQTVTQRHLCHTCKAEWENTYKFVKTEVVKKGENIEHS